MNSTRNCAIENCVANKFHLVSNISSKYRAPHLDSDNRPKDCCHVIMLNLVISYTSCLLTTISFFDYWSKQKYFSMTHKKDLSLFFQLNPRVHLSASWVLKSDNFFSGRNTIILLKSRESQILDILMLRSGVIQSNSWIHHCLLGQEVMTKNFCCIRH